MSDSAARDHAVTAMGSVLVQAPAGSGKTTLLAQRYLRLLATVDSPERILALTFTRRAAEEMRRRVMDELRSPVSALGGAAQRHMLELGVDLLRHPSRLRIQTIDAFNAWMVGELPVTALTGSRLNRIGNAGALYREAARRALAYEANDPVGRAVDRVLELDDQRWDSLVKTIADMLGARDRWLPLLAGELEAASQLTEGQLLQVRKRFDEDLHLLVSRALRNAYEALGQKRLRELCVLMHAASNRLENASPSLMAWRADGSPLGADAAHAERWRGLAEILLRKNGGFRTRLTKTEGFPANDVEKQRMTDLMAEFARQPAALHALTQLKVLPNPRYDDRQWQRIVEVARLLLLSAAKLEEVFRERGAVDFPFSALAALRALGGVDSPTDLALRLDYRLHHILVDEFQDTSGTQLELVKRLTAGWQQGDGRSIFCVGDPMQSIYGFREAEVRAFLELADEGIGEVRFDVERLNSNFRSTPAVVRWVNSCFARIFPHRDDRERGAIAYRPSEAAGAPPDDRTPSEIGGVQLRAFTSRQQEGEAIAETIAAALARHPTWKIGVLVRARAHARDIILSLRARSIAFQGVDLEPLSERPAVRDLLMLISALLHWGDRNAWLAVLRGPWVGLTLADLLRVARARPIIWEALTDDAVIAELSADGIARCGRIRAVLEAAIANRRSTGLVRWVEQTWLALGGAACAPSAEDLSHVAAVFTRLRELDAQGLPDPAELLASFADLYARSHETAPVEIMTVHKAKGLEFDLVVVPALEREVPGDRSALLISREFSQFGRSAWVMAAKPGVGADKDRLFEFMRTHARDAAALEAQRLLYVACTRAKRQLNLTAVLYEHELQEYKPRANSLLAVLWPNCREEFAAPPSRGPAADSPPAILRGGPLRRVAVSWSPTVLAEVQLASTSIPRADRLATPAFDWAGETARRIGSLVHAELHSLDLASSDIAGIDNRIELYRHWLASHGVPQERIEEASSRAFAALVAVHGDERGRWILRSGYRDDFREHALSGLWRGERVRVVFDRSFIDDAGIRWVIDYKTSHHGGGDLERFLDNEAERYRPQLERYAHFARKLGPEPVRVGLYFPLLRAWREWDPLLATEVSGGDASAGQMFPHGGNG